MSYTAVSQKRTARPEDYTPSEQVRQSQAALEAVLGRKPGAYVSEHGDALAELKEQILGRPAFSYDVEADPLYGQYRDQYRAMGAQAMEDTMGQAAALTGGYGSTYSQKVGHRAYEGYLSRLNDMVPKLYREALELYDREGKAMMDRYDLLAGLENDAYDRYSDAYSLWLKEYGLAQDRYDEERDRDYAQYMDLVNFWQKEAAKAASSSGGSGGSRSSGSGKKTESPTGSTGTENANVMHTNGMTQKDVEGWAREYLAGGQNYTLSSSAMQNWMRQHGIYGTAADAFKNALRSQGYGG